MDRVLFVIFVDFSLPEPASKVQAAPETKMPDAASTVSFATSLDEFDDDMSVSRAVHAAERSLPHGLRSLSKRARGTRQQRQNR